nr:putative f-box/lrr-repeat protein [Quercus suber]
MAMADHVDDRSTGLSPHPYPLLSPNTSLSRHKHFIDLDQRLLFTQSDTDYPGPTRTNSNFSFLDAVSIIWALRNAIPLRKLCLHWTSNCDSFLVSTWVQDTLLHGGLQELNLYIFTGTNPPLEMSTTLFFSSTLVSLRLRGAILLNPPPASASTFPSLRTLALGDVGYAKHDSISTLLAACPVLQDLSLIVSTSNFDGLGESADKVNVIVLVPTLKTLHIQWPAYDCWLYKLQINTPALEWFHFEGGLGEDVVLESLPNLVEAVIELEDEDSNSVDYAKRVLDFSRPLLNVQSLKLSIEYAEVFCNPYKYGIPMFHNLSSLMFYGELRPHWYAWDVVQLMLWHGIEMELVRYVLKEAKVLKTMKITVESNLGMCFKFEDAPRVQFSNAKALLQEFKRVQERSEVARSSLIAPMSTWQQVIYKINSEGDLFIDNPNGRDLVWCSVEKGIVLLRGKPT